MEESRFKRFNLFNKKEIEKATKHINDEIDEYVEEFYIMIKKIKKKTMALNFKLSSLNYLIIPLSLSSWRWFAFITI